MKTQSLFSSKDKTKKLKCRLLHFLFGASGDKILLQVAFAPCTFALFYPVYACDKAPTAK